MVVVTATTAELEHGWPGFPQSLSLVLHNLIMFPVRGLSKSSSRESQAALAHGLVVDHPGGPLGLLGKQSPQGRSAGRGAGSRRRERALLGRGWELRSPGSGAPAVPQAPAPPIHPSWRLALGEAERKSRLFGMPRAGLATAISFMCHRWL